MRLITDDSDVIQRRDRIAFHLCRNVGVLKAMQREQDELARRGKSPAQTTVKRRLPVNQSRKTTRGSA